MRSSADEALLDENGNVIERFLPINHVAVPEVVLSGNRERICVADGEAYWHENGNATRIGARTLRAFIGLADQSVDKILRFATRYGLLGLCQKHRLPYAHNRTAIDDLDFRAIVRLYTNYRCTPAEEERVEDWRSCSQRFRMIFEIRQRLRIGEVVPSNEWEKIGVSGWRALHGDATVARQDVLIQQAVNKLLMVSGIHPVIALSGEPQIGFGSHDRMTLFGALAMQLAMAVCDSKIAICSACHQTYGPRRRPHPGEANYCPRNACKRAGTSNRVQRLRDRQRDAGRTS